MSTHDSLPPSQRPRETLPSISEQGPDGRLRTTRGSLAPAADASLTPMTPEVMPVPLPRVTPIPSLVGPEDSWTPMAPGVIPVDRDPPTIRSTDMSPVGATEAVAVADALAQHREQSPRPPDTRLPQFAIDVSSTDVTRFADEEISIHEDFEGRPSDPGDELDVEDLVSVESLPGNRLVKDKENLPPMRPQFGSLPPPVPPSIPTTSTPSSSVQRAAAPAPPPPAAPPATSPASQVTATERGTDGKRRVRAWWEDLFGEELSRTVSELTPAQVASETGFIEERLGLAKGASILDVGCGSGQFSVALAKRGYDVTGFDLSIPLLARAADTAAQERSYVSFVHGDMREMPYEESFDGAVCWSSTFGYFDDETNAKVIGRIHRALKRGGIFVMDVTNRDFVAHRLPSMAWFEADGCICMDEAQMDWIASRLKVKRTVMTESGRSREVEYSVRLYSLHELGKLLNDAGFRVVEVSGRPETAGVFFGGESPRVLIAAEKR